MRPAPQSAGRPLTARPPTAPARAVLRAVAALVASMLALLLAIGVPSAAALVSARSSGDAWRTYRPPTDAPVLDPFRPPPEPWLPGNRGIEYATSAGATLVAIGPGVVAFAGPVAGRLVVSILHPDGLRSALTGVAAVDVDVGDRVWAGAPVAVAGERTHLGVRRGEAYLDPASLWGTVAGGGSVHLVPAGAPAPSAPPRSTPGGAAGQTAATLVARLRSAVGW